MSLYAEYIAEREGRHILENEYGFMTYIFLPENVCFITDAYVVPEYRKHGLARHFLDNIIVDAKEHGCTKLLATVCIQTNNATDSLKTVLAGGFELKASNNTMIYLERSI